MSGGLAHVLTKWERLFVFQGPDDSWDRRAVCSQHPGQVRICAAASLRSDGLNSSRGINTEPHGPACVATLSLLRPLPTSWKARGFWRCLSGVWEIDFKRSWVTKDGENPDKAEEGGENNKWLENDWLHPIKSVWRRCIKISQCCRSW